MRIYLLLFLFLIIFSSIAHASLIWAFDAGSGIITHPILFNNNIIIGTEDGQIFSLSNDGKLIWKRDVGRYILQPVIFQDELVVATSYGKISTIRKDGAVRSRVTLNNSQTNITYIYGIAASNKLYLTTDKGLVSSMTTRSPT